MILILGVGVLDSSSLGGEILLLSYIFLCLFFTNSSEESASGGLKEGLKFDLQSLLVKRDLRDFIDAFLDSS
jgi:hypothetical protein